MAKIILLLILIIPVYSYSQNENIKEGYFYLDGKKIEGNFEFKKSVVLDFGNGNSPSYKKAKLVQYDDKENEINTYTVKDLQGFVLESDSFVTVTGMYSFMFKVKKGKEWAKVLIDDELSLYKFSLTYRKLKAGPQASLAGDDYYFIRKKGEEDYLMFLYSKSRTKQLAKLIGDYQELSNEILDKKKIETFEELLEYINLYNKWKGIK